MSDITIQQTLKIIDGRLSPSVDPIDGDLVEVSKAPNNAIEIKEDGLYVPIPTVSETPSSGGEVESIIVRNIAQNGSYADKLSPSKSLLLNLPIKDAMVDTLQNTLVEPYTIDLSPYNFKVVTDVTQVIKDDLGELGVQGSHFTAPYSIEEDSNKFVKNIKVQNLQGLINAKIVNKSPIQINGNQNGVPSLYEIKDGMQSISGYAPGGTIIGIEVNGLEVHRFTVGYYNFSEVVPYTFQAGETITIKHYDEAGTEVLGEATQIVATTPITINNTPQVDKKEVSGTFIPSSTFTLEREHNYETIDITANEAGQWTYTSAKPFRLNEHLKFSIEGQLSKATYVENNPAVDLSVSVTLRIDGVIGETLDLENKINNSFILNSLESDAVPITLPSEVTHRYKIKHTKTQNSAEEIIAVKALSVFKNINSIEIFLKQETRSGLGNNAIQCLNSFIPVLLDRGDWTVSYPGNIGFRTLPIEDLRITGYEVGSTTLEVYSDIAGEILVEVDGTSYQATNDFQNRKTVATVPELTEGQLVKVSYSPYNVGFVTETIECTVGTDNPVLTLNRPPHVDYSAETEYFELEVKGVLV